MSFQYQPFVKGMCLCYTMKKKENKQNHSFSSSSNHCRITKKPWTMGVGTCKVCDCTQAGFVARCDPCVHVVDDTSLPLQLGGRFPHAHKHARILSKRALFAAFEAIAPGHVSILPCWNFADWISNSHRLDAKPTKLSRGCLQIRTRTKKLAYALGGAPCHILHA